VLHFELAGKPSAVEANGVVPVWKAAPAGNLSGVYVVPNPYIKGQNPAGWDLTPSSAVSDRHQRLRSSGMPEGKSNYQTSTPFPGTSCRVWNTTQPRPTGRRSGTWSVVTGKTLSVVYTSSPCKTEQDQGGQVCQLYDKTTGVDGQAVRRRGPVKRFFVFLLLLGAAWPGNGRTRAQEFAQGRHYSAASFSSRRGARGAVAHGWAFRVGGGRLPPPSTGTRRESLAFPKSVLSVNHTAWLAQISALPQAAYIFHLSFLPGTLGSMRAASTWTRSRCGRLFSSGWQRGHLRRRRLWRSGLTYARSLTDKFSTGLSVNYVQSTLATIQGDGPRSLISVPLYYNTGYRSLKIAWPSRTSAAEMTFIDQPVKMPTVFRVGMSMNIYGNQAAPS